MPRVIMLIPIGIKVGLTSVSLGIFQAMKRKLIRPCFFKPIFQSYTEDDTVDKTTAILHRYFKPLIINPIKIRSFDGLDFKNQRDFLIEKIIANYYNNIKDSKVVLVEGIEFLSYEHQQFSQWLNYKIAHVLNANVIFIASHNTNTLSEVQENIQCSYNYFKNNEGHVNILGIIVNKLNPPVNWKNYPCNNLHGIFKNHSKIKKQKVNLKIFSKKNTLPILGEVPWNIDLISVRVKDIIHYLNATVVNVGEINTRVKSIIFCLQDVTHVLKHYSENSLIVASIDRHDILIATCLSVINGMKISGILLTGGHKIDSYIIRLCECAFLAGLSIFTININILEIFLSLKKFSSEILIEDYDRIKCIQEHIANYINSDWLKSFIETSQSQYYHKSRLSPEVFRYQLTEMARKANKRIILPEGNEPRTLKAAVFCEEHGISSCTLLGDPDEINCVAQSHGIKLSSNIKIIDPKMIHENYIYRLLVLRKNKGMTEEIAREKIKDNVVLGTLMLEENKVDGLVSGAVHTTANTIRPPLQLIKTAPGNSLISSVFFMLFPEQVCVYGDCAINIDPTAEELAEIAIQSANSAKKFGIDPYVAMLSYSTGTSGSGKSVEKVYKATQIVKEKCANLLIDGPLQYDAAVIEDVAKLKTFNSPVAGHATVFIFPDLNSGNITYKAVQRSAKLVSIGPMLQGMRKPVNDLSRGALVDDIIYTIALTAIQADK